MKLPELLKILVASPSIVLLGWFFCCSLLLIGSGLLLWGKSIIFHRQNSIVLAVEDQQQLDLSFDEPTRDKRITILEQFLKEKNSPLATQAATMIEAADTYKFDWRLLPAIAGKESSFGKKIPWDKENGKSLHNAWGWGVYGDKAPSFSSWEEAIKKVAEGLRHEYYNKGYITPEIIMEKFAPRSNGSWARDVKVVMEQIAPGEEQGEKQNDSKDQSL